MLEHTFLKNNDLGLISFKIKKTCWIYSRSCVSADTNIRPSQSETTLIVTFCSTMTTQRFVNLPSPHSSLDRPIRGQEGAMPERVVVDRELAALWFQGGKWPRSLWDVKVPAVCITRSYAITDVFWKCVLTCVCMCASVLAPSVSSSWLDINQNRRKD